MPSAAIGDTTIFYESFGDPADPALVLISGLNSQLTSWSDEFCMAFVDRGFRVVRFDNRDSGLSTIFPDDQPYSITDMADDTAGLIELLNASPAHVVGMSMGAMIGQTLAALHPGVVASLTSIGSTTGNSDVGQPTAEAWDALLMPRATTPEEAAERDLVGKRIWGTAGGWDEAEYRQWAAANFERSAPEGAALRQLSAIGELGDRESLLATITAPTLVIHGSKDTLIDPSGGRRTAECVPGSTYLEIEGMGHDIPQIHWPEIVHAVTDLAARARSEIG